MTRLCVVLTSLAVVAGCPHDHHKDTPAVRLLLNKMMTAAKAYAAVNDTFPRGTSMQLPFSNATDPGAKGCCGSMSDGKKVDNKCPVSNAFAIDPIWALLEVSPDEPSFYRFMYESTDGKTFTITAVGDLDCDTTPGIYTVRGSFGEEGYPKTELEMPRRVY